MSITIKARTRSPSSARFILPEDGERSSAAARKIRGFCGCARARGGAN
jgi:hypothetical protein